MKDSIMQHERNFTRQNLAAFKAWYYNHDKILYAFDYSPDTIHLSGKRLVVPTVLLIGHNTASAAEDFLISAADQPHMIRIGECSYGSTGQPFLFDLPGGGGARVCTKKDTYPDGREFVGYGVVPEIVVQPAVKDFIDNKDPALDKSLSYLQQQIGKK
jgi:C-terminal processing protease CtpA/Prc